MVVKLKLCLLLVTLHLSTAALGKGFDSEYLVYQGDYNTDGKTDFYIYKPVKIIILHGDIAVPITILPDVKEFFLIQDASGGSFSIQAVVPGFDLAGWQKADVDIYVSDVNYDGFLDLRVVGIPEIAVSAVDQIVFASATNNTIPAHVTPINEQLETFSIDVAQWFIDPNYFNDNAPLTIVGAEPASRVYFASVFDPSSLPSINFFLADCEVEFRTRECGASTSNPSTCVQWLELFNEAGESQGFQWVNVCNQGYVHIYAYEPGSVTLAKDYSVFNQDAIDYAEAVAVVTDQGIQGLLNRDLDSPEMVILNDILAEIIKRVFGQGVFGEDVDGDEPVSNPAQFCQADNSFDHGSFPMDDTFDQSDPTFHHYDVETKVCDSSDPSCGLSNLTFNMLRKFTYPSRKLVPTDPPFDGFTGVMAYISPPILTHKPSAYMIPIGRVTQVVLSGASNWPGAVQNITLPNHGVYPGTISRIIVEKSDGFYIFTHGIGLNRAFNTHHYKLRPIHILLGCANDVLGVEAFQQLDKQAIKFREENRP